MIDLPDSELLAPGSLDVAINCNGAASESLQFHSKAAPLQLINIVI